MSWPRLVVLLSALPFVGIGLAFVAAPGAMAPLVGLEPTNVTADNDLRAVYGGLSLGCAALLAWCGVREERIGLGVSAVLFLYGGLAAGRFVSLAVAGAPEALGFMLHAGELVGLGCGLSARWMLRAPAGIEPVDAD